MQKRLMAMVLAVIMCMGLLNGCAPATGVAIAKETVEQTAEVEVEAEEEAVDLNAAEEQENNEITDTTSGEEQVDLESIQQETGYTPIRGVDYWTPEDVAEIEAYCLAQIKKFINNSNSVLVSEIPMDESVLSTGSYVSATVGSNWKDKLVAKDNSCYTPDSIDVSAYIGGKIKIMVSKVITGGTRNFGFCDSNDIVTKAYTERETASQFVYNPDTGLYELTLDIADTNFFFSYTKANNTIKFEILPPPNMYSRDEIDKKIENVDDTIEMLKRVIGLEDKMPAGLTPNEFSSKSTRITTNVIDKGYAKSIFVSEVEGYQCAVFCNKADGTQWTSGWASSYDNYNIEHAETLFLKFRKSDNSTLTETDFAIIAESLEAFLSYGIPKGGGTAYIETAYVSTSGSDDNDGSASAPFATVNKALLTGASTIMMYGGVYEQTIDLKNATKPNVEIRNYSTNERVIFTAANRIIAEAETAVDGYKKVYSVRTDKTFPSNLRWIYQDGINDETTLITGEERHPLQRGYEYRCHDTKISICTATTLDKALAEIERSTEYKWYYDAATSVLYFSRPAAVTANNPICGDLNVNRLFLNGSRNISVKAFGIETKYMTFNVDKLTSAELYDCKAANVCNSGAFTYNRCLSGKFVRCEATRCQAGNNGDGFNGHASNTGDIYSKQVTVSLIDCWSHDNNDDGYSDHERSETTMIGGLYEYNKKGGVTPSYGSHCTCYNVYSRNNYNGFYYTGLAAAEEGGKYGQMTCFGCVAENNTGGKSSAGFKVDSAGNSMFLSDCKAINNDIGYVVNSKTSHAKLIDCGAVGNTKTISNKTAFEITNTMLVVE